MKKPFYITTGVRAWVVDANSEEDALRKAWRRDPPQSMGYLVHVWQVGEDPVFDARLFRKDKAMKIIADLKRRKIR